MALVQEDERDLVSAVAALIDCNPFLPKRLELERRVLGDAFTPVAVVWHADTDDATATPNAVALRALVERLGVQLQQRLAERVGLNLNTSRVEDEARISSTSMPTNTEPKATSASGHLLG